MLTRLLITLVMFSSCGSSDSGDGGGAEAPQVGSSTPVQAASDSEATALEGSYVSSCVVIPSATTIKGLKYRVLNKGKSSIYTMYQYGDVECKNLYAESREIRTMVVGDMEESNGTKVYNVDYTYEKVEVTLYHESLLSKDHYGLSNWNAGETRDVTGLTNTIDGRKLPDIGETYYEKAATREEGRVFVKALGAWTTESEGRSPENRYEAILKTWLIKE